MSEVPPHWGVPIMMSRPPPLKEEAYNLYSGDEIVKCLTWEYTCTVLP